MGLYIFFSLSEGRYVEILLWGLFLVVVVSPRQVIVADNFGI